MALSKEKTMLQIPMKNEFLIDLDKWAGELDLSRGAFCSMVLKVSAEDVYRRVLENKNWCPTT